MPRIHDLRCDTCDSVTVDVWVTTPTLPSCPICGGHREFVPFRFHTDVHGQPTHYIGLGKDFTSHHEALRHAKSLGFDQAPSAEKHHGARNDSHQNLGKVFSFQGSDPGRRNLYERKRA